MDILQKIKDLMADRSWSAYRLAQLSGVNPSTLTNLFARNNLPTIPTLERLCAAFGLSLAEFFSDDPQPQSEERLTSRMLELWNGLSCPQKEMVLKLERLCEAQGLTLQEVAAQRDFFSEEAITAQILQKWRVLSVTQKESLLTQWDRLR